MTRAWRRTGWASSFIESSRPHVVVEQAQQRSPGNPPSPKARARSHCRSHGLSPSSRAPLQAKKLQFVGEVFYYALKTVLYPMAPLYDPETQSLKPLCVRALKRIFLMCDKDKDGLLNDKELNEFQVKCFNAPLQPEELAGVKDVVRSRLENGLVDDQLTFTGFVFLHALFIERGRLETTWAVRPDFTLRFLAQVPIQHRRSGKGSFRRAHERSARRSPPSGDCSVTGVG
jgi:hypothetical protein